MCIIPRELVGQPGAGVGGAAGGSAAPGGVTPVQPAGGKLT